MTQGRFRHVPVVENGRMVGLISIGDVVKARLSELAMEKDALEGMITGR
jgi:CBS domain-containing protein